MMREAHPYPDPSPMALAFVRDAMASWEVQGGDVREIATAMLFQGYGAHLILGGRADIIEAYERAARALDLMATTEGRA